MGVGELITFQMVLVRTDMWERGWSSNSQLYVNLNGTGISLFINFFRKWELFLLSGLEKKKRNMIEGRLKFK